MKNKKNNYLNLFKGSLKFKMIGSFMFIIILMGILNVTPFIVTKQTTDKMNKMVETTILANELVSLTNNIRDIAEQYMTDKKEEQKKSILDNLSKINADLKILKGDVQDKAGKASLDTIERVINTYNEQIKKVIEKNDGKNYGEAMDNKEKAMETMVILKEGVNEFVFSELSYYKDLKADIDRKSEQTEISIIVLIFIIALLSIVGSTIFSRRIANAIFNLAGAAQEIANGNLQGKEIKVKTKDEIFMLAKAFNKMSENLRSIIGSIAENSNNVIASANTLESNVKQNSIAAEQITATIEQVSAGASEQSEQCEKTVKAVNELYASNMKIDKNVNKALQTSEIAIKAAGDGNEKINTLIKQINTIEDKILETEGTTELLKSRMDEIKSILDIINSVSEQTNLLALNAAIEAARAGEYGKGFAVVADEIRKLSERSSGSTKEITEMLKDIQNKSNQLSISMAEGVKEVKEGTKLAEEAKLSFTEIVINNENVDNEIKEINIEVNKIVKEIKNVEEMSKNIYNVSKETSTGSHEVAALMEEQGASLEEISSFAEVLKNTAEELKIIVNEFKI